MYSQLLSEEHNSDYLILALSVYFSHVLTKSPGISEKFELKYGETLIGMPIFMDDIAAIGGAEDIRKGIRNCRKMEIEKKMEYGLTKTNIVVIKTGKGITEKIEEEVRAGEKQRKPIKSDIQEW